MLTLFWLCEQSKEARKEAIHGICRGSDTKLAIVSSSIAFATLQQHQQGIDSHTFSVLL